MFNSNIISIICKIDLFVAVNIVLFCVYNNHYQIYYESKKCIHESIDNANICLKEMILIPSQITYDLNLIAFSYFLHIAIVIYYRTSSHFRYLLFLKTFYKLINFEICFFVINIFYKLIENRKVLVDSNISIISLIHLIYTINMIDLCSIYKNEKYYYETNYVKQLGDNICLICHDDFNTDKNIYLLNCKHYAHSECYKLWWGITNKIHCVYDCS